MEELGLDLECGHDDIFGGLLNEPLDSGQDEGFMACFGSGGPPSELSVPTRAVVRGASSSVSDSCTAEESQASLTVAQNCTALYMFHRRAAARRQRPISTSAVDLSNQVLRTRYPEHGLSPRLGGKLSTRSHAIRTAPYIHIWRRALSLNHIPSCRSRLVPQGALRHGPSPGSLACQEDLPSASAPSTILPALFSTR